MKRTITLLLVLCLIGCTSINVNKKDTEASRKEYLQNHPNIDIETKEAILEGPILVGMTKEQVVAMLGDPKKVVEGNKEGSFELHYSDWYLLPPAPIPAHVKTILYFEDGKYVRYSESGGK